MYKSISDSSDNKYSIFKYGILNFDWLRYNLPLCWILLVFPHKFTSPETLLDILVIVFDPIFSMNDKSKSSNIKSISMLGSLLAPIIEPSPLIEIKLSFSISIFTAYES